MDNGYGGTALVIVDMVKDFTDPEGLVFYPQNREVLPRIARVLEKCRETGQLVIFLQHCNRAEKAAAMRPNCIEGTDGIEIDPMLPVDPQRDYVIRKRRYSGFFGTDLDLVLRENGIKNLIVVGTKTNCCIRATVTDAFYLNYISKRVVVFCLFAYDAHFVAQLAVCACY